MIVEAMRFPRVALRHRDILAAFVVRDLKARYEGSLLGRLWPVLHPAMLLAVYALVFAKLLGQKFAAAGVEVVVGEGWVTTFFMLSGILPWICVVESLTRCTPVVIENNNLIKKVAFPSELLPTYATVVGFVQMLIGFALFVPLYAAVLLASGTGGGAASLASLLWLPLPIALQFVFVAGLGMLLAAVNVFVRDVGQVIPLATLVWMFFSPVFYRIETLTGVVDVPWLATAMQFNPLVHLLALYRACFRYEEGATLPLDSLGIFAAIAFATFVFGHGCFQRWKGQFADEV